MESLRSELAQKQLAPHLASFAKTPQSSKKMIAHESIQGGTFRAQLHRKVDDDDYWAPSLSRPTRQFTSVDICWIADMK